MSDQAVQVTATLVAFDPLRDARHRDARAARECADWLAWLQLEGKAARTLDSYERTIAALLRAYPNTPVDEFTHGDVLQLLKQEFKTGAGLKTRIAHLASFFGWLERMGDIDRNPMRRVPRPRNKPQHVVETFTDPEILLLTGLPSPDGALFSILFDAGLRKGEARHLKWGHIRLDRNELVVYQGKGGKDRIVPISRLSSRLADLALLEGLEPTDYLWYTRPGGGTVIKRDKPIGEASFVRWYTRCLATVGVPYRPRTERDPGLHNPHATRHTFATRWLRRGGRLETLSLVMGHASIKTTFDLYGHLDTTDIVIDLELVEG